MKTKEKEEIKNSLIENPFTDEEIQASKEEDRKTMTSRISGFLRTLVWDENKEEKLSDEVKIKLMKVIRQTCKESPQSESPKLFQQRTRENLLKHGIILTSYQVEELVHSELPVGALD